MSSRLLISSYKFWIVAVILAIFSDFERIFFSYSAVFLTSALYYFSHVSLDFCNIAMLLSRSLISSCNSSTYIYTSAIWSCPMSSGKLIGYSSNGVLNDNLYGGWNSSCGYFPPSAISSASRILMRRSLFPMVSSAFLSYIWSSATVTVLFTLGEFLIALAREPNRRVLSVSISLFAAKDHVIISAVLLFPPRES